MTAHGLINATEMYLKAVYELEEDGVVPLRARIADRLGQSAPTVSQTVARLQRDGLLRVDDDRHLELSAEGRRLAVRVMRKHRLAEVLLHRVIGLDWAQLHAEACRWEHVISESVERRIFELCGRPAYCPYGAPIPGLADLGVTGVPALRASAGMQTLHAAMRAGRREVRLHRISERMQDDVVLMRTMAAAGLTPGALLDLDPAEVRVGVRTTGATAAFDRRQASMLVVCDPAEVPDLAERSRAHCVPAS